MEVQAVEAELMVLDGFRTGMGEAVLRHGLIARHGMGAVIVRRVGVIVSQRTNHLRAYEKSLPFECQLLQRQRLPIPQSLRGPGPSSLDP